MSVGVENDHKKLRRYVVQLADATGRSELTVLQELQGLLEAIVPELADALAMPGWRRVRAAIDAEYDDRYGLGVGYDPKPHRRYAGVPGRAT